MNLTREQKLEKLGHGPWMQEPDHVAFEHAGVPCILHRNDGGAWCGYAAVEPGHPWHGEANYFSGTYDDESNYTPNPEEGPSVHGGVTYGDKCQGDICHVTRPNEPDDVWWLGFDCAHSGDLTPGYALSLEKLGYMRSSRESYKDLAYVRRETESLAEQVVARRAQAAEGA